ncbi:MULTISPECIES: GH32 C-terminal domain-containing protein [unclassified Parabacteroides]|nr:MULTISPECIES: GH32 C-terminal domain-containing protein [unclassified Parabacteroides]
MAALFLLGATAQAQEKGLEVHYLGDQRSQVRIETPRKYLLLPVEEGADNSWVNILVDNEMVKGLDVRLAVNKVDYFVPVDLSAWKGETILFNCPGVPESAVCWKEMKLSDTFDTSNREKHRPTYHFSPQWGWMNDPNGMVYKDGEYHLFYQHNPYGSMWGNMHWGHAVSKDLTNWEHLPVAIDRDDLGAIFSGSAVVDENNTAGFGRGAIVAFYTSEGFGQTQCVAYSNDNGRSFTKYDKNPVLTANARDFRDPKVFWYKETNKWVMILAVGQEMQLFSSPNLKDWTYESSFGEGMGAHEGVWECPDLFELPVKGTNQKKWVLICNINPVGPFGGSATQYFTGTFDGKTFVNESPSITKWMDWGKDHYATVTWSNAPANRTIAIAWMSNWQYANDVPTKQYRSANSVPRDLELYVKNGETYLSSTPSPELLKARGKAEKKSSFTVNGEKEINSLLPANQGSYEVEITFRNNNARIIGFDLLNSKGETVKMFYSTLDNTFTMDRRNSGEVNFSSSFPCATTAPAPESKTYTIRLFVDKSSVEAFDGKGEFVMTNIVFPEEPYNSLRFHSTGGSYTVSSLTVYPLIVNH